MTIQARLAQRLFEPIDAASLVVFRVAFGAIMLWEVGRYFAYGWIHRFYIEPQYFFTYYGFGWVAPWPGAGMYWHFVLLGVLACLIMFGAFYRLAAILFFLAFSYVFLLDQTRYLNHFYLVILVAFLLIFLPANVAFSADARGNGKPASDTVPAWSVWALRLQFEVLYIFAGVVKINPDWLRLQPLAMWLGARTDLPLVGSYLAHDWVVAVAAYGVILLHVVGAPLLLWRRARPWIFALYCAFHLANHLLFEIGIFPWLTLAGTLLFFEPDWPRRLARGVLRRPAAGVLT